MVIRVDQTCHGNPIDAQTHSEVIEIFENNLRLLHPFMPFLSEELWHDIACRNKEEALVVSSWPTESKSTKQHFRYFHIPWKW